MVVGQLVLVAKKESWGRGGVGETHGVKLDGSPPVDSVLMLKGAAGGGWEWGEK